MIRALTSLSLNLICAVSIAKGLPYLFDQLLANGAAAETATYSAGLPISAGDRPHAMGRIPHGRQARPVIGPAVHVLLMACLNELQLAELALCRAALS